MEGVGTAVQCLSLAEFSFWREAWLDLFCLVFVGESRCGEGGMQGRRELDLELGKYTRSHGAGDRLCEGAWGFRLDSRCAPVRVVMLSRKSIGLDFLSPQFRSIS